MKRCTDGARVGGLRVPMKEWQQEERREQQKEQEQEEQAQQEVVEGW
jgi:hypothetical protein